MKQTPLKPGKPLERKSTPKRRQPKRDWRWARAKVEQEGACRLGRRGECFGPLEAAHVISREHDYPVPVIGGRGAISHYEVRANAIVPLCRHHHGAYDRHEIDLLPALTLTEQVQAVKDAGGIENARIRLCPSQYRKQAA